MDDALILVELPSHVPRLRRPSSRAGPTAAITTYASVYCRIKHMTKVNIQETDGELSRLLELVEAGEEVLIARAGRPIAKLVRTDHSPTHRVPGTWKDAIHIAEDFDDELPESWIEALEP